MSHLVEFLVFKLNHIGKKWALVDADSIIITKFNEVSDLKARGSMMIMR